jgi:gentisate 1,2-dioxygenase
MTTQAGPTHYEVQKKRRARFLEEWRRNRRTGVVRETDVALHTTSRGVDTGVYVGADGDSAARTVDALVHEVRPGAVSTAHRHSWDATLFIVRGSGWTEIDGRRYDWRPWDALHVPAWAWHRHGNGGDKRARFMSFSSEPIMESFGMGVLEESSNGNRNAVGGRLPNAPARQGSDPYARRVRRLATARQEQETARLHTAYDDIELKPTPRGTRTAFLIDQSIGYRTSGLTQVLLQFAPGKGQSMHRHPGEAYLYVVEGRGHSYMGTETTGGRDYEWKEGDLIVVDHFLWHQHFNDDPSKTARLVRVHMFASLLETMRALLDPLVLFEEPSEALAQAADISDVVWPEEQRPS